MKDDIDKAMKCGEIMLPVFADFSEALDIINSILHKRHFSKTFLYLFWVIYQTNPFCTN